MDPPRGYRRGNMCAPNAPKGERSLQCFAVRAPAPGRCGARLSAVAASRRAQLQRLSLRYPIVAEAPLDL